MTLPYEPGDDLVFQLESGFGLMRVLASEPGVWHVLVYEDFYPDVESAEAALARGVALRAWHAHLPLTERALERTPAARLGNRPVTDLELTPLLEWRARNGEIFDRSVLQMLGLR